MSFPCTECEYFMKSWWHRTLTFRETRNKFSITSLRRLFVVYWYELYCKSWKHSGNLLDVSLTHDFNFVRLKISFHYIVFQEYQYKLLKLNFRTDVSVRERFHCKS